MFLITNVPWALFLATGGQGLEFWAGAWEARGLLVHVRSDGCAWHTRPEHLPTCTWVCT